MRPMMYDCRNDSDVIQLGVIGGSSIDRAIDFRRGHDHDRRRAKGRRARSEGSRAAGVLGSETLPAS